MKTIRPNPFIEELDPYKITPQEPWVDEDRRSVLKLDWNEGLKVPEFARSLALELLQSDEFFTWYPDYAAVELHEMLSAHLEISALNLLSFPGSDSALEVLCRTYLSPGDSVAIVTPSYENFDVFAASVGAKPVHIRLEKPFIFSTARVIEAASSNKVRVLYMVNPNNPCGYCIAPSQIEAICEALPNVLIICDQAYVEFAPYASCCSLATRFPNLVVVRTFSKAFSLAGFRIGYLVASHDILKYVAKIRNGKNLSMLSQRIAIACLRKPDVVKSWIEEVIKARQYISGAFQRLGVVHYESHANFVLFEPPSPEVIVSEMKRRRIFIRDKSKSTGGGIRVTVTDLRAMRIFEQALEEILAQQRTRSTSLRWLTP